MITMTMMIIANYDDDVLMIIIITLISIKNTDEIIKCYFMDNIDYEFCNNIMDY